jgi:hypothetical protein
MAGEAGGHGAVEDVEAEGDAGEQIVDLTDAEQVLGRLFGQQRRSVPPIASPSTAASEM